MLLVKLSKGSVSRIRRTQAEVEILLAQGYTVVGPCDESGAVLPGVKFKLESLPKGKPLQESPKEPPKEPPAANGEGPGPQGSPEGTREGSPEGSGEGSQEAEKGSGAESHESDEKGSPSDSTPSNVPSVNEAARAQRRRAGVQGGNV